MDKLKTFPPLTKLIDDGIEKEIEAEFKAYNEGKLSRYPLSPSTIGKCALKLARDVAHYHGLASYPRSKEHRSARVQRIFKRGGLLEGALIGDIERYTSLKVTHKQQRVWLFDVSIEGKSQAIEGDVDCLVVCEDHGAKILTDFKSKGAYYSAGFGDSILEFFTKLKQTGFVDDLGNNCYMVNNVKGLFDILPPDDFFVDYLLQLNSYAFSDWFKRVGLDGVALYYENKNTCGNYELRWVPDRSLFDYARGKFQHIYKTVMTEGPEKVDREFNLGSARCRLCEYNDKCNGAPKPKTNGRIVGKLFPNLDGALETKLNASLQIERVEADVLLEMEKHGWTHVQTSNGMIYERKFLKSPRPHYELRLVK